MEVYGKECMSRTHVFEWHKRFHEGRTIGVARIFDWGGPKPQITRNDVIRNFRKRNFLWGKDIVEWKI